MPLLYEEKTSYRFRKEVHPRDFPVHIHNAVEICMMIEGSCRILYENRQFELTAGDIFFAFPNQPHGYESNCGTVRYLLILPVKPHLEMFYKLLTENVPESPILRKGTWEHLGLTEIVQLGCVDAGAASVEVMQGYFAVIVGKLLSLLRLKPCDSDSENILRSILLYIHSHYREPVTRKDIARSIGYNESYISHVFSQVLHMSLSQYIHTLRVDDAVNLLRHTKMSVTQIASELGFGSIRSFNRVFLDHTGVTPMDIRKNGEKMLL